MWWLVSLPNTVNFFNELKFKTNLVFRQISRTSGNDCHDRHLHAAPKPWSLQKPREVWSGQIPSRKLRRTSSIQLHSLQCWATQLYRTEGKFWILIYWKKSYESTISKREVLIQLIVVSLGDLPRKTLLFSELILTRYWLFVNDVTKGNNLIRFVSQKTLPSIKLLFLQQHFFFKFQQKISNTPNNLFDFFK